MENQITIINPKEFGLEENKALELTSGLTLILTERETLKNAYIDVIDLEVTEENLPIFKELRIKIMKNRTQGIDKWHKEKKEVFLRGGQFVDALKKSESFENETMESNLLEKEKHFENIEKERLKAVHLERVALLIPLGYEIGTIDFSGMDANMFNAILLGAETDHKNKIEAEKQAELERLEVLRIEAEEKEKQRLEMIELKKQNEIKEKQIELERIESAKIQAEAKAKSDAEIAEVNRLAKIESDKQLAIIAKQKVEADKLASELKAKLDAEIKEKQRIESENKAKLEAEKKLAKAPDKERLLKMITDTKLICSSFDFKTKEAEQMESLIIEKFGAFQKWANEQINTL